MTFFYDPELWRLESSPHIHLSYRLLVVSGEGQYADGMQILVDYREDGITPFMIFIKEGIYEEKV